MERPRVLLGFGSEFGATAEVASVIADVLRAGGVTVDVYTVADAFPQRHYGAAVIGSAIYNGTLLPEVTHFIQASETWLRDVPVALFTLSMTMRVSTPTSRRDALAHLKPTLATVPSIRPVSIGLFGGRLRYRDLPLHTMIRFWLESRLPSGDFRDWDAIRAWAADIQPLLLQRTNDGAEKSQIGPR